MLKSVLITVDKEIYNVISYNFLKLGLVMLLIASQFGVEIWRGATRHAISFPTASLVSWLQPESATSNSHDHLYTVMGQY